MEYLKVLDTDSDEVKEAKKGLIATKDAAVAEAKELLKNHKGFDPASAEGKEAISAIVDARFKEAKVKHGDKEVLIEEAIKSVQEMLDEVATKQNGLGKVKDGQKSFGELLGEALEEKEKEIKGLQSMSAGKMDFGLRLKAAADMSYAANFSSDAQEGLTTEFRQSLLPLPSEQIWMRNIIPGGTTDKGSIFYPRHTGGEGEVAIWDETVSPREAKPQIDFDFDAVNQKMHWLSGVVRVPREMLDDVSFLRSFLQTQLLIGPQGLYQAENDYMLNHSTEGLLNLADAYDGTDYTVAVDRIIDAAWGQIVENYFQPNVIILHPRDAVGIALNKASDSGLYDLPNGSVGWVNGRLTIAGLQVVATTEISKGNFLVGDRRASQFITRMSPEIRFFDQDQDNVIKNMITVRVEERAALLTYYPDAWVTGTLAPTT